MDRNFPCPCAAEFADDQRAGLHHALNQPGAHRCTPRITKMTQSSAPNRHLVPRKFQNHGESEPGQQGKRNV